MDPRTPESPPPPPGGLPSGRDAWASGEAYEAYVGRWSRLVAVEFLSWLAVAPGSRWLDVGCGTGVLTAAIVTRADPASVVGIDPAATFLELATTAVVDPRVRFAPGSAAATGLPDAGVDVTVSGLVLNFVPDIDAAMRELRRVTAPGGRIAAYVWDYGGGMEFMRRFWDAAVAEDPAAAPIAEAVRFSLSTPGALREVFERAGCLDVETAPIDIPTTFRDFDDFWRPFLGGTGPAPAYLAAVDEDGRAAIRDRLQAELPMAGDGTIPLTARAWAVKGRSPATPAG